MLLGKRHHMLVIGQGINTQSWQWHIYYVIGTISNSRQYMQMTIVGKRHYMCVIGPKIETQSWQSYRECLFIWMQDRRWHIVNIIRQCLWMKLVQKKTLYECN